MPKKSIQELFSAELLSGAQQKIFNYCKSVVAYNQGNGRFRVEALPVWVQLSSVNAVEFCDVNADGRRDLLLGGNKFVFPPQFGRLDASYGHMLLNEGGGKLKYVENRESGMSIRGEIKAIRQINTPTGARIIAAVNNEKPVMYRLRK